MTRWRPEDETAGEQYLMGSGRDSAFSCTEAGRHVCAAISHARRESRHIYKDNYVSNVDPQGSSRHHAEAIAVVKSSILDAVQQSTATRWLYDDNNQAAGNVGFTAMGPPEWSPGSSQVEVNDAYQIMQIRSNRNCVMNSTALNCNLPVNRAPDCSGSAMQVFPFVAPVSQEQVSTVRAHQIPTKSGQACTSPLLVGGVPSTRILPSHPSIKPCSTQLTIFYAGKVNVYNEVSLIKAQKIMLMAASRKSLPLNMDMLSGTSNQMVNSPAPRSLKMGDAAQLSQTDPLARQTDQLTRDQSGIGSVPATISQPSEAEVRSMSYTQSTYPDNEPAFPRALPQARKASLARFLEKRKERVLLKSPYPEFKTFL